VAAATAKGTVSHLHLLAGRTLAEVSALPLAAHWNFSMAEGNEVEVEAVYAGQSRHFSATQLLGMLLGKLKHITTAHAKNSSGEDQDIRFALAVPSWMGPAQRASIADGSRIGGLNGKEGSSILVGAAEALCKAFVTKHPAEEGAEEQRTVVFVDHGQTHLSLVVASFLSDNTFHILHEACEPSLGVAYLDLGLFNLLQAKCEAAGVPPPQPGTKSGMRLVRAVERLRKLLSTMPEATVQVENLADDKDISISLTRSEMAEACSSAVQRLGEVIDEAVQASKIDLAGLTSVEILGGGSRMPMVQEVLTLKLGVETFGQKLDDASLAFGAALIASAETPAAEEGSGEAANTAPEPPAPEKGAAEELPAAPAPKCGWMDAEALESACQEEAQMQAADQEVAQLNEKLNAMESFILEMRQAPSSRHGTGINAEQLSSALAEAENWMMEVTEETGLSDVEKRFEELQVEVKEMCKAYFEAIEEEKRSTEKELEEEAKRGAAEREAEGEDDRAEKDTRRLPKADRMRKVMKHKETGTELFKGKNYLHAAKHYKDALTHCSKFFDLSPEDEQEVRQVRLILHLNLAQCWVKLDNFDQVLKHANEVLAIDDSHPKALFRRAMVYEKKKEYDLAKQDLLRAQNSPVGEKDASNIATLMKRINILIKKEKDKEKKMWGKVFG